MSVLCRHHIHYVCVLDELEGRGVDVDGVEVHLGLHLLLLPPHLLVQRHVGGVMTLSRKVDLLAAGGAPGAASATQGRSRGAGCEKKIKLHA